MTIATKQTVREHLVDDFWITEEKAAIMVERHFKDADEGSAISFVAEHIIEDEKKMLEVDTLPDDYYEDEDDDDDTDEWDSDFDFDDYDEDEDDEEWED